MTSSPERMREIFRARQPALEDFWERLTSRPRFERRLSLFGHDLSVRSNNKDVLRAIDVASSSYSIASEQGRSFRMTIVVDTRLDAGSDPSGRLPDDIHYVGAEAWLSMGIGSWGRAHIDLAAGDAVLILDQRLAADPIVLARWVLHTVWTNFLISSGYGVLHATALFRDGTLLCFVAPHNSGKSTTALRLAFHRGYRLMSDSLLFVDGSPGALRFNAFPVGRVSLRDDSLEELPELARLARPAVIRSETKYDIDLSELAPELVQTTAVYPDRILLYLLERHENPETLPLAADPSHVRRTLVANSMFYDSDEAWAPNLAHLDTLVRESTSARLVIGTEVTGLLDVIDQAVGNAF
jgi:hypothetical protein